MSSPTPPPAPSPTPARKKPSGLASCILLGLILVVVSAIAGGGFWAYKTFVAKPAPPASPPAAKGSEAPAPTPAATETKTPATPTIAQNTPPKTPLIEAPTQPSVGAKTATDPLDAKVTPPTVPTPAEPPAVPPTQPPTAPKPTVAATEPTLIPPTTPLPEPGVPPAPADPDPIVAAEPIQSFPEDSPQVAALKADADRRIDEAPTELYSDADKQRVRDAIRQSKRLTRVATLQFGAGASALGSNEKTRLKKALLSTEAEALLSDPQAVFFIIGFADATGASDANRKISQKRAAGVADVLKAFKVTNSSYAVGIGATTLLSAERQSRNRATEVWIVLP